MRHDWFDVAVIGAGPSGSWTAFRLASLGHKVAVLERHPAVGLKPCCTGIISRACIEQFHVPDDVIFKKLNSAVACAPSGESVRIFHPQYQAGIVDRSGFDKWLARKAQSQGACYFLNHHVISLNPGSNLVETVFQNKELRGTLKASAVVLASGFNSPLVKQSGLGQPGYHVIGVQASVKLLKCDEVEVYFDQKVAPGFFAWLAPVSHEQALAGLMTRKSPGEHLKEWLALLARWQKINPGEYQAKLGGIPLKPLPVTSRERLLVVGDAAGQVKPTTGGGIFFGMQCADIAAAVLHNAIAEQDFSLKQLGIYDKRWRALLMAELKREYLARRVYQLLSNRQIDGLFRTALKQDIVDSLMAEYTSFDNHGSLLLKGLRLCLASQAKRFTRYLSG